MSRGRYFFITKDELISIMRSVQESEPVFYVETGNFASKDIQKYESLEEYEDLGIKKSGEGQSESFLVLKQSDEVIIRERQIPDGSMRYLVDQMENKDSIVLWPGGIYGEEYFICGHIGTISATETSIKLFNLFAKYIKRQCKIKIGRYYISESAKEIYSDRRFITISIKESMGCDIKF